MTTTPEDMIETGVRRVLKGEGDVRWVQGEFPRLHWTRRMTRLAALILPFDRHGVVRDAVGAARSGGLSSAYRVVRALTRPPDRDGVLVSRKYGCVWRMTPKVATQSIRAAMLGADPECEVFDMDDAEFRERLPEAREWFCFAFIRHPFSRALSFWWNTHFSHELYTERTEWLKCRRDRLFEYCHGLAETRDFDAYCRWLHTPYGADSCANRHVLSLGLQIRDAEGRLPDFVGRLEDFAADWRLVAARAGIPVREPPLLHSMAGWRVSHKEVEAARTSRAALLTDRNKALLAERYAGDLELGGYSPADLKTVGPSPNRPRA